MERKSGGTIESVNTSKAVSYLCDLGLWIFSYRLFTTTAATTSITTTTRTISSAVYITGVKNKLKKQKNAVTLTTYYSGSV